MDTKVRQPAETGYVDAPSDATDDAKYTNTDFKTYTGPDYSSVVVDQQRREAIALDVISRLTAVPTTELHLEPKAPDPDTVASEARELTRRLSAPGSLRSSRVLLEDWLDTRFPAQTVMLHLLPEAARVIGERWNDDTMSFSEVTVALGHLQQLIHRTARHESWHPRSGIGETILLAAIPGETHTFGVGIVAEFFRREAWDVEAALPSREPNQAFDELMSQVARTHCRMIGLSIGCDRFAPTTADGDRGTAQAIQESPGADHDWWLGGGDGTGGFCRLWR